MKEQPGEVGLAILAGGQGSRMGCPKHTLLRRASGESLLHFQCRRWSDWPGGERFVVGLHEAEAPHGWRFLADPQKWKGHGPLAAILAALEHGVAPWLAVLPVDAPGFSSLLFQRALQTAGDAQWVTFADRQGHEQWLCSLIKRELAEAIRQALESGQRAVHQMARSTRLQVIPWSEDWPEGTFCNLNSPEQLGEWVLPSEKTSSRGPR